MVKLKDWRYLKAWVVFTLLTLVYGFLAAFLGGSVIGYMLGTTPESSWVHSEITLNVIGAVGFMVGLVFSYMFYCYSISLIQPSPANSVSGQSSAT